jgi:hypothetical protein
VYAYEAEVCIVAGKGEKVLIAVCIGNIMHLISLYEDCLPVIQGCIDSFCDSRSGGSLVRFDVLSVGMLRGLYVRACEAFEGCMFVLRFVVRLDCDEKCDAVGLSANCLLNVQCNVLLYIGLDVNKRSSVAEVRSETTYS